MQKSTVWTIVIVVILVVLGIILLSLPGKEAPDQVAPEEEVTLPKEGLDLEGAEEPAVGEETPPEALKDAETVVPEGSLVSDKGEVLTSSGEIVNNEALPGSPTAPKQSRSLAEGEVPEEAIQLRVTAAGFEPNEFTVKANSVVTLSATSGDRTHVFKFDDSGLQGVAIGIAGGETRAITFKAPSAGDYTFFCDVPGHRGRGETGVMHVK
ncbi:cupredoxin domain-containing protein [Patescibacteria group bacterium]|nr:cupredoxin domain-containing protein [Patescibacteria group bacterium]